MLVFSLSGSSSYSFLNGSPLPVNYLRVCGGGAGNGLQILLLPQSRWAAGVSPASPQQDPSVSQNCGTELHYQVFRCT